MRNYSIEEINRNELMSKKHKKVCTTLNCINSSFQNQFKKKKKSMVK